ncbi:MAG: hypothetical protein IPM34_08640 [Saprospiraceae bacterium]|nr:hypothetical protein [Saprospiraceae bacterium]
MASIIFAALVLRKYLYWVVLILAFWVSDLAINNLIYPKTEFVWITSGFMYLVLIYGLIFIVLKQLSSRIQEPLAILFAAMGSSLIFFFMSNLAVWLSTSTYMKDWSGFVYCYIAAIPFFGNEIAGTIFYSSVFFTAYWLFEKNTKVSKIEA